MILILLVLTGCRSAGDGGDLIPIPTTAPPAAGVSEPVENIEQTGARPDPATAPAGVEGEISAELVDRPPVDDTLVEIDDSICAEAAAVQAELAEMKSRGEDVAELEIAVAELLQEFENCQP